MAHRIKEFGLILAILGSVGLSHAALSTGLILQYDFDNDLTDSSVNGNDGTNVNASFVTDRFGNPNSAIHIQDTDSPYQYFTFDASLVDGLTDFTFAFYAQLDGLNNSNNIISGANASTINGLLINYNSNANHGWQMLIDNSAFYSFTASDNVMDDFDWHHVAVMRDGSSVRLYVDGSQVGSDITGVVTTALDVDTGGMVVGQDQDSIGGGFQTDQNWEGSIDDFRLYNRALSAAEVAQLSAIPEPSRIGLAFGGVILVVLVYRRRMASQQSS